jgi:hypothetical protein
VADEEVRVEVDARQLQQALRAVSREGEKQTRRELAAVARRGRDRIRGEWVRGPNIGGHSFRAVTSGTKGFVPYIRLDREYRPYIGWLLWGGRRPRDRRPRQVPSRDGLYFYPELRRMRPEVRARVEVVLSTAIRRAGLG